MPRRNKGCFSCSFHCVDIAGMQHHLTKDRTLFIPREQGSWHKPLVANLSTGLSSEGRADAVGESDHGHVCFAGPGHWAPHWGPVATETLWSEQPANLTDHDEEHPGPWSVPTDHHLHAAVHRCTRTYTLLKQVVLIGACIVELGRSGFILACLNQNKWCIGGDTKLHSYSVEKCICPAADQTYLSFPLLTPFLTVQASTFLTSTAAETLRSTPLPLSTTPSSSTPLFSCNFSTRSTLARSMEREMSLTAYLPTPSSAPSFWGPSPCR